jgi:hypothetical protein
LAHIEDSPYVFTTTGKTPSGINDNKQQLLGWGCLIASGVGGYHLMLKATEMHVSVFLLLRRGRGLMQQFSRLSDDDERCPEAGMSFLI